MITICIAALFQKLVQAYDMLQDEVAKVHYIDNIKQRCLEWFAGGI